MTERIDDGFPTLIAFAALSGLKFWEKTITPPGMSMGGENDTTTMRNTAWRTKAPKKLKTLTEASITAAWDPALFPQIETALLGVNNLVTIEFPDGDTLAFWAWLDEAQPNEITEGEQPTIEIVVIPSNQNDSQVETAPVHTAAA